MLQTNKRLFMQSSQQLYNLMTSSFLRINNRLTFKRWLALLFLMLPSLALSNWYLSTIISDPNYEVLSLLKIAEAGEIASLTCPLGSSGPCGYYAANYFLNMENGSLNSIEGALDLTKVNIIHRFLATNIDENIVVVNTIDIQSMEAFLHNNLLIEGDHCILNINIVKQGESSAASHAVNVFRKDGKIKVIDLGSNINAGSNVEAITKSTELNNFLNNGIDGVYSVSRETKTPSVILSLREKSIYKFPKNSKLSYPHAIGRHFKNAGEYTSESLEPKKGRLSKLNCSVD